MTLMCIFIATNLTKKNKNSLSRLKYKNKNSSLKLLKRGPLPPQLQRPAFFRLRPFDTSFYVLAHVHQHKQQEQTVVAAAGASDLQAAVAGASDLQAAVAGASDVLLYVAFSMGPVPGLGLLSEDL